MAIILAVLLLAVIAAGASLYAHYRQKDAKTGNAKETEAQEEETTAEEAPLATLLLVSDYQYEPGFPDPAETFAHLMQTVKAEGMAPDNVIICGDYTNDDYLFDYQLSPDDAVKEIRDLIGSECPGVPQEDIIFVQGNHDALTGSISESGLHEYDDYLVYVLNTQYDFPWKQGRDTEFRDRVIAASEEMEKCFDGLAAKGETRPVFIAGHVPLHFTARTSSRHTTGDNMYSAYIFDAVNKAAESLDIIYLFGHDHSKGWDCYLGGAAVYRAPGDTLLIPDAEDRTGSTDEFTAETLKFTYLNAGYTGFYMNCAPEEYSSDAGSPYRAADETLSCTTAEIYEDRIVLTRYDEEGAHVLGAAGEADPYMGGIDEGLIDSEYYSKETAGPVTIKRNSAYKNGRIRSDTAEDKTEEKTEEEDAA